MIPPSDPKGNGTEQGESVAPPQKEAVSEPAHVLQITLSEISTNSEDTQHQEGGGSNATSEVPSGARAKRDNPYEKLRHVALEPRASSVTEKDRRGDTDNRISVATLNSATQTVSPSAAPALVERSERTICRYD